MASESRRESPAQLTICGHTKHYSIKQTVRGDKHAMFVDLVMAEMDGIKPVWLLKFPPINIFCDI